jgi:hypothetical protein
MISELEACDDGSSATINMMKRIRIKWIIRIEPHLYLYDNKPSFFSILDAECFIIPDAVCGNLVACVHLVVAYAGCWRAVHA